MCSPPKEKVAEGSISHILLPDPDPVATEAEVEDIPPSLAHILHLISSGRVGVHPEVWEELARANNLFQAHLELYEARELQMAQQRGENINTTNLPSTEVIDLHSSSESTSWAWTGQESFENYNNQVRWSDGVNEPENPSVLNNYHNAERFESLEMQNSGNIMMPPGNRMLHFHQPVIGTAVPPQIMPFRLVPFEQTGMPHIQLAQAVPQPLQFASYGQVPNVGTGWVAANGTIIGSIAQHQGFAQPPPPMTPMQLPYRDDGSARYFEGRQPVYYEGRPLVYVSNPYVAPSCCEPSLMGLPVPPLKSSSMQWRNTDSFHHQVPEMQNTFSMTQGYDTRLESSTDRDSYESEATGSSEEYCPCPPEEPRITVPTFWDKIENSSCNDNWTRNQVANSGLGAPGIWAKHPINSGSIQTSLQTPESPQAGSELYSSDSSYMDSAEYGSSPSNPLSSEGEVTEPLETEETDVGAIVGTSNSSPSSSNRRNKSRKAVNNKTQNFEKNSASFGIRSLLDLLDCGTTFYMNGKELPYVINAWDATQSSNMNPKPPKFKYYVPPNMNDGDFFGGQQQMWQMKMIQYFGKCRPDIWRLQAVPDFHKSSTENWINFTITSKLRFCCRNCSVPWTSKKGKLVFAFLIDSSKRRGWIFMKMFGQVCMRKECLDWSFQTPACYPEEIDRAVHRLFDYISYVYYGIPLDPLIFSECSKSIRPGNPQSHHRKDLCQACLNGVCKVTR